MQSFVMALRSIRSNKMRSVLTMLGIIIGVLALVVLVSLVSGATSRVTDAVASLGNSLITATITDDKGSPITLDTLDEWADNPALGQMAPYASDTLVARHGGESGTVMVYGTNSNYYTLENLQLSMGRWLNRADLDSASYVCVINEAAAEELIGYTDCAGQTLTLGGAEFTVIGVLQADDENLMSVMTSGTMMAYIPYTTLIRLSTTVTRAITGFYVAAPAGSTIEQTEDALDRILLERFDEDDDAYSLSSTNVLEEAMDTITSSLSILLGGIAAISLVVGGIGIMNIMLVTVTERTREIGIRKAIGASRLTILTQFLMEAVVLCMMGCGVGIFLSWAILQIVNTIVVSTGIHFSLNAGVVTVSVVFCFLIGLIFGLYPANKAAKMKPIDALHYGG